MAFNACDYDGDTPERDEAERRERIGIQAEDDEERTAREMEFHETHACELECYETLVHTLDCQMTRALTRKEGSMNPRQFAPQGKVA